MFFISFYFGCVACGILVPRPGIEPRPSVVRAQSPNRWTEREFPGYLFLEDSSGCAPLLSNQCAKEH